MNRFYILWKILTSKWNHMDRTLRECVREYDDRYVNQTEPAYHANYGAVKLGKSYPYDDSQIGVMRFTLESANGGTIVRATIPYHDRDDVTNTYVIPSTENLQTKLSEIITYQILLK